MPVNKERLSDDELLRLMLEGNESAFVQFCECSLPNIVRTMRSRCQRFGVPPDLVRDFVQDAFLRTVERFDSCNRDTITIKWFVTVAKNKMFDWMRKERRKKQLSDEQLEAIPDRSMMSGDMSAILEEFERLSPRDQEVLRLVLFAGYTPAQSAPILGIGEWSAYKRYERALSRLRDMLKEEE